MVKPVLLIGFFITVALIFSSCEKKVQECCVYSSIWPISRAGNDTILAMPADSTLLDGSGSYDPSGSIKNYRWSKVEGFSAFIRDSNSSKTMVSGLQIGTYRFQLKVTNNSGVSSYSIITVQVEDTIYPPHPVGFFPFVYPGLSWDSTSSKWMVTEHVPDLQFNVDPNDNNNHLYFEVYLILPGKSLLLPYVDSGSIAKGNFNFSTFYTLLDAVALSPGEKPTGHIYIYANKSSGIDFTKKAKVILFVKM